MDALAQNNFIDIWGVIDAWKKGNRHDLDFAPPDNFFHPIFSEEGKYDEDGYV